MVQNAAIIVIGKDQIIWIPNFYLIMHRIAIYLIFCADTKGSEFITGIHLKIVIVNFTLRRHSIEGFLCSSLGELGGRFADRNSNWMANLRYCRFSELGKENLLVSLFLFNM